MALYRTIPGVHMGDKIAEMLREKRITNKRLAAMIRMNPGSINMLLKKSEIPVKRIIQISNALQFNFFKHYTGLDKEKPGWQDKLAELRLKNEKLENENKWLKEKMEILQDKYNLVERMFAVLEKK